MQLANILLRITGDSDDARRELTKLSAELAGFGRIDAEAEADVDTGGARAKLAALRAQLAALGRESVNIDVDVGRGFAERIRAMFSSASSSLTSLGSSASELTTRFGGLSGSVSKLGPAIAAALAVAIPVIVSLTAAVAALAASLTLAAAGAGAIGIAMGALLVPGVLLGIGVFQRFKAQADIAGTAANRLKTVGQEIGQVFSNVLAPAADKVLKGLADGLRGVPGLLRSLKPQFLAFGGAVGDAFKIIGKELTSPAWRDFFSTLLISAKSIVPAMTDAFTGLANTLRNIASAALPFVVRGMQAIGDALRGLGTSSGTAAFRRGVEDVIGHLRSWLNLIGQISRGFLGFVRAAAPAGQRLVDAMAQGAEKFADWINSAEGQQAVKRFFDDLMPLAQQLLVLTGRLIVFFARLGQVLAPTLTPLVTGLNAVIGVINKVLGAFNRFPGIVKAALNPLNVLNPTQLGSTVATGIIAGWNKLKPGASAVWNAVKGVFLRPIRFVVNLPSNLISLAQSIWTNVRSAISRAIRFVINLPGGLPGQAKSIWSAVKSTISAAITFVLKLPGVGGLISIAKGIWDAINAALPDIEIGIKVAGPSLPFAAVLGGPGKPAGAFPGFTDPSAVGQLTPATVTGPGGWVINNNITAPAGEAPDAETLLAQIDSKLRARGGF